MIDLISLLGYSEGSPFSHNPYLDISSPEGLIDMSNTPIDLIGVDNKGNKKRMKAGRRKPYKFQGDTVREFPAKQMGGLNIDSTLNANKQVPFVDRILNPSNYPVRNNKDGSHSTHLMSVAGVDDKFIAYPELRWVNGKWVQNQNPDSALKDKDFIWFNTQKEAEDFSKNYKKGRKLQYGGYSPEDLYNFLFEEDEVSPVAPIIEEEEQQDNSQELRLRDNRIKRLEAENQAMAMFMDDEEEIYNNPYSNIPAPMSGPITNSRANNSLVPVVTPKGIKEKEDYAFNFFVNKGYTPQIAAGIVANIRHESNFNPATVGDGGKAKGIAQWHPDRYSKLAKNFDLTTLDGGLAAIDYELNNSESSSFKKISKAQTAEEAAALVDQHYERSAGLSRGKRVSSARDIYSRFAKYQKGGTYQIPHEDLVEMKNAGYKFSIIP